MLLESLQWNILSMVKFLFLFFIFYFLFDEEEIDAYSHVLPILDFIFYLHDFFKT